MAPKPPKDGGNGSKPPTMYVYLLGGLGIVLLLLALMVFATYQQAASHHSVIHMFDARHDGGPRRPQTVVMTEAARAGAARFRNRLASAHLHHRRAGPEEDRDGDGGGNDAHASESAASDGDVAAKSAGATTPNEIYDGAGGLEKKSDSGDGGGMMVAGDTEPHQRRKLLQCGADVGERKTEYWGDVVVAGDGGGSSGAQVATSAECCTRCVETPGCNVWVHCATAEGGDAACEGQCWLKRVGTGMGMGTGTRGWTHHGNGDTGTGTGEREREREHRSHVIPLTSHGDTRISHPSHLLPTHRSLDLITRRWLAMWTEVTCLGDGVWCETRAGSACAPCQPVDDPAHPTTHAAGPAVAWTSGALLKDYDPNPGGVGEDVASGNSSSRTVALITPQVGPSCFCGTYDTARETMRDLGP